MNWYPKYSVLEATPDMVDERDAVAGEQITYVGYCSESTQGTDQAKWRILRYRTTITADGKVTERTLADGSVYFIKVWDDRETYNYLFRL